MTSTETAILTALRALQDESEIRNLIATYGPLVDHGDPEAVADLWTKDGRYEVDNGAYENAAAIADMVRSDPHMSLIRNGCSHFLGPLHVRVDGDTATATGYSMLIVAEQEQHIVRRVSANKWELIRTAHGWRATRRVNRRMAGAEYAHQLLVEGLAAPRTSPPSH